MKIAFYCTALMISGHALAGTYTTLPTIRQSILDDDDIVINSTDIESEAGDVVIYAGRLKWTDPLVARTIDIVSANGDVTLNLKTTGEALSYTAYSVSDLATLTIRAGAGKTITVNDETDYTANRVYSNAFLSSASEEGITSNLDVMSKAVVNNTYRGALASGTSTITFHENVQMSTRYSAVITSGVVKSGSDNVGGAVVNFNKNAVIRSQAWCFLGDEAGTFNIKGGLTASSDAGTLINLQQGSRFNADGSGAYYLEGRMNIAGTGSRVDLVLTGDSYWIGQSAKSSDAFLNLDLRDLSRWEITKNTMVNHLSATDSATLQFDLYSGTQVVVGVSDTLSLGSNTVIRLGVNFYDIDQSEEMMLFLYSGQESDYLNEGFTMITRDGYVMDYAEGTKGIGWYRFLGQIPEPASATLAIIGLAFAGWRRRI